MVQMSMLDRLLALCCCRSEDDDQRAYAPLHNENDTASSATVSVRPRPGEGGRNFRDYADSLSSRESPANRANGGSLERSESRPDQPPRTRDELERDAFNAIVDNAQQNTIDVTHMDVFEGMKKEELQAKTKKYDDVIRAYENKERAKNGDKNEPSRCMLLEDSSNRYTDWLGRPPMSPARLASTRRLNSEASAAITESVVITNRKPLVMFMDT